MSSVWISADPDAGLISNHGREMIVIELRPFTPKDSSDIVALWERARWDAQPWLEERMGYTHRDNVNFFENVLIPNNNVWVASSDGATAGFLAMHEDEINFLYVDPPFQRGGVGSALLNQARELSPSGLSLYTHQRNERARRFYEKSEFTIAAFGVSPAPESEPDVRYDWQPAPAAADSGAS